MVMAMMNLDLQLLVLVVLVLLLSLPPLTESIPTPQLIGEVSAVYDLIARVLSAANSNSTTAAGASGSSSSLEHPFRLELAPRASDDDDDDLFFQLQDDATSDGILITGTTANELSAGFGWYLRHYCNMTIGWPRGGGSHVVLPQQGWPKIGGTNNVVKKKRQVPWSYLMNVCTHSYSLVWYSEKDWEQFIDWLALTGINLMLALTGQEEVAYQVFRELGLQDLDIRSWFNGPALLTWSRGQNEYGSNICGPLPRSWMKDQYDMQRNHILPRLRSLGIVGQLPGFQGNVPIQLKALYKDANMTQQGQTAWMDSLDPLYGRIADLWMKKLLAAFGTDHWYQLDGYFNGATAPWIETNKHNNAVQQAQVGTTTIDNIFLDDYDYDYDDLPHDDAWFQRGTAAYQGLARTDPKAIWSFQGFAFIGWDKPAQAQALKGFIDAANPPDHFVIIDMAYVGLGEWQKWDNASYFGTPFVWTALHDFGGTDAIKGDLKRINQIPFALQQANTSVIGLGGTPEGIDQNPTYYDFLFEGNWRDQPVDDLAQYISARKQQQYGFTLKRNKHVDSAWRLLVGSLYSFEMSVQDNTGVAHLEPRASLFAGDQYTPFTMMCQVYQAWQELILAATPQLVRTNEPFRYDLINLGREVLAQLSAPMALNFTNATKQTPQMDANRLKQTGEAYIELLQDIDTLVSTDQAFLVGPWIESARKWGDSEANDCYSEELNATTDCAHFFEWNARTQITTWNPTKANSSRIPGGPIDYAAKHWGGLIRDYYAARAQIVLDQALKDQSTQQPLNQTTVNRLVARHAYQWTTATNPYTTQPVGDPLVVSNDMFFKYMHWFITCEEDPEEQPEEKEDVLIQLQQE